MSYSILRASLVVIVPTILLLVWHWLSIRESDDPEVAIRAMIAAAAAGVEVRDLGAVVGPVSERFRRGELTQADVKRIVFAELNRRTWSRALLAGVDVEVADGALKAKAVARVGLARGDAVKSLEEARAKPAEVDLYRFELELEREPAGWKIVGAEWRPIGLSDLLPGD